MQFDNTLPSDIVNFYVILQRHEHENLNRIMNVVQSNPDFFECSAGQSVFESVARTLERMIEKSKQAEEVKS